MNYTMKQVKSYPLEKRSLISVTHAVGALLMLILLPISAVIALSNTVCSVLLGLSLWSVSFWCFLSSTVYHAISYVHLKSMCFAYRPFHDLHYDRSSSRTSRPYLDEQLDGLQHYLDPMGHYHLWYSLQDLCQKVNESSVSLFYLIMGWLVILCPQIVESRSPIRSSGVSCSWAACATRLELDFMLRKNHTSTWFGTSSS